MSVSLPQMQPILVGFSQFISIDLWISLDKDVHCCCVKGTSVSKMMANPSKDHWHMIMSQYCKYCKSIWCNLPLRQSQVTCYCSISCDGCEGGNDDNNGGSLQCFGLQIPTIIQVCMMKQIMNLSALDETYRRTVSKCMKAEQSRPHKLYLIKFDQDWPIRKKLVCEKN